MSSYQSQDIIHQTVAQMAPIAAIKLMPLFTVAPPWYGATVVVALAPAALALVVSAVPVVACTTK